VRPRLRRVLRSRTLACLGGLVALVGALAPLPAGADPESDVEATALDRTATAGHLVALGPDGVRVATASGEKTLAPAALRSVRRLGAAEAPATAPQLRLTLVGGDERYGRFAGPAQDGLSFEDASAGTWTVPFEAVRSIEALPADGNPCADAASRFARPEQGDRIHVRSGDTYAGIVTAATAEGLEIRSDHGETQRASWADLVVAHLDNPLLPAPAPDAVGAEVATSDGGRLLAATYPTLDGDALVVAMRAPAKTTLRVPWHEVRAVRTRDARYALATEVPFTSEFVPFYGDSGSTSRDLESRWHAPRVDRRPGARPCPLRLHGVRYDHGFGVEAKTRITIPLGKAWASFDALVGIDDEGIGSAEGAPIAGNVDARVIGDGKVLWEAKGVKGGEEPRVVGPIDVSNVDSMTLEIDFGQGAQFLDRADWADPVLVRK
jgi:hypothetical protein